jgi:hypothetical protein
VVVTLAVVAEVVVLTDVIGLPHGEWAAVLLDVPPLVARAT